MTDSAHVKSRGALASLGRWIGACLCILYGFAKLNGSQFTVLDSELARPLGDVSGFWLTWHYFGYSPVYGTTIALLQIIGGMFLIWPRTALVGALLLLPIVLNIVLIDVFFGIALSGTLAALLLLGCLVIVIAPHSQRLLGAVLIDPSRSHVSARWRGAILALIVVSLWTFTWWVANYNNRFPTRIDGAWSVVADGGAPMPPVRWERVFFERNRAHLVVFRATDGTERRHHFEIDADGVVRVWQRWLVKDDLIMRGMLQPDGDLELKVLKTASGSPVRLRRVPR